MLELVKGKMMFLDRAGAGRNVFVSSYPLDVHRYDTVTVTVQFPPPQDDSLLCSDVEVATLRKGNLEGNCILSSSKNF